jgi:hypothetical protein
VSDHSCQTKCWMNNFETIYKIRVVASFASCSLGLKHIASWWALELTIQNSTLTYTKITSRFNKRRTSSQFEVRKWMKLLNWPQNMTCCKTQYMCLQGTHFFGQPDELEIIATKSKQVQAGKFLIVISYCFLFGFWLNRIL